MSLRGETLATETFRARPKDEGTLAEDRSNRGASNAIRLLSENADRPA
jgi:hypothetical protein